MKTLLLAMSLYLNDAERIALLEAALIIGAKQVTDGKAGAKEEQEELIKLVSEEYVVNVNMLTGAWMVRKLGTAQAKSLQGTSAERYNLMSAMPAWG